MRPAAVIRVAGRSCIVAIEKSIRAHSASASTVRRARGAFPTIRVSAGVRTGKAC